MGMFWAVSSVGRAPARQAGGHWFEPSTAHRKKGPQTRAFRCISRQSSRVGSPGARLCLRRFPAGAGDFERRCRACCDDEADRDPGAEVQVLVQNREPTSAAIAGSSARTTPNTFVGNLRSASSSRDQGRAEERRPSPAAAPTTCGSRRPERELAMPHGVTRSSREALLAQIRSRPGERDRPKEESQPDDPGRAEGREERFRDRRTRLH